MLETPKSEKREREKPTPKMEAQPLSAPVARLCQLSMQSLEARKWMQAQDWRGLTSQLTDGSLLEKLLAAEVNVEEPAATSGFLTQLSPEEQAQLSGVLALASMPDAERTAQVCWLGLQRDLLLKKRDSIQAALRSPQLEIERTFELQKSLTIIKKEVLDLQKRLTDIARPFP